jgi:hypothetical protein
MFPWTSVATDFRGVTGGVYKARERIHRSLLICDYYRFQLHEGELQPSIRTKTQFRDLLHITVLHPSVHAIVARV